MCHRQHRDEPPAPWDTSWDSLCPTTTILHYHGLIWETTNQLSPSVHTDLRLHLDMHKALGRGDWDCPTLCTKSAGFLSPHTPLPTGHKWFVSSEPPRTALFHKKKIKVASPAVPTCGPPCSGNPEGPENAHFSSEAHQRLPGLFPTSEAADLSAFSVTISHQKRHPSPDSVNGMERNWATEDLQQNHPLVCLLR